MEKVAYTALCCTAKVLTKHSLSRQERKPSSEFRSFRRAVDYQEEESYAG
jgi:hypothetical protein